MRLLKTSKYYRLKISPPKYWTSPSFTPFYTSLQLCFPLVPLKGIYVADNLGSGCEAQTSTAFNIMEICQEAPAAQKSTKLKELMQDDLKKEAEDILEMLTRVIGKGALEWTLTALQPGTICSSSLKQRSLRHRLCDATRTHAHICPVGTIHIPSARSLPSFLALSWRRKLLQQRSSRSWRWRRRRREWLRTCCRRWRRQRWRSGRRTAISPTFKRRWKNCLTPTTKFFHCIDF